MVFLFLFGSLVVLLFLFLLIFGCLGLFLGLFFVLISIFNLFIGFDLLFDFEMFDCLLVIFVLFLYVGVLCKVVVVFEF